jgi:hypothetical protein
MKAAWFRRWFGWHSGALVSGTLIALAFATLTQAGAAGATTFTVSLDVGGMTFWGNQTQVASRCGTITPTQGRELHGTGQGGVGAFMTNLVLPNRAKLTRLTVVAHDNDTSFGSDAYIVRKRMTRGNVSDGLNGGYVVLAHVATSGPGASGGITDKSTNTIAPNTVDTVNFAYMAVVVNCHDTVDPIGVQVVYTH